MSYSAIVARVSEILPIPKADNIVVAVVLGGNYIVSKKTKVGDIGVLFPSDGVLSKEFTDANNLVGVYTGGKHQSGGFFQENRRVRAQKFKGIKSDGFFCELDLFNFIEDKTGKKSCFKEGDQFESLNGIPICQKYVTPATLRARELLAHKVQKKLRLIGFNEHFDTAQLRHNILFIKANALLTLTYKLHGTSGRSTRCLVVNDLPWYKKIVNKFVNIWPEKFYKEIIGTRHTVLEDRKLDGYYKADFRHVVHDKYFKGKIKKGFTFYYEIVGYTETGASIMNVQDNTKLKEKSIVSLYGPKMEYSYGCPIGECEVYVYRVTVSNEDGEIADLSWAQVKALCIEIGVKTVPEIKQFVYDGDSKALASLVESCLDKPSILDSRHIEEGVCVRVEQDYYVRIYKDKGWFFKLSEGICKEDVNMVDTEEIS